MCGIIGIINGNKKVKSGLGSIFEQMLFVNQLRGRDGAGVFWYDEKKDHYQVIKNESLKEVFGNEDFQIGLRWLEHKPFVIGHNRAATKGSVATENNHPFDEGNVVLVHNGTMTYVPKEFDKDTVVDSHAIAKMINQTSTEEFIKDSFGAYALAWFDKVSRELFLLRNKDRPLNILYFKDFALISSEVGLARWIAERNNFELESVEELKEHHLYKFEPYNLTPTVTDLSKINKVWSTAVVPKHTPYTNMYEEYEDDVMGCNNILPFYPAGGGYRESVPRTSYENRSMGLSKELLEERFNKIGIWEYLHKTDQNGVVVTEGKSGPTVAFRKGDTITFSLDSYKMHKQFKHFVGTIPGLSVKNYEVKGNIIASEEDLHTNTNFIEGVIATIVNRKDTTTIWVRDAKISNEPDPQFAVEIPEVVNQKK